MLLASLCQVDHWGSSQLNEQWAEIAPGQGGLQAIVNLSEQKLLQCDESDAVVVVVVGGRLLVLLCHLLNLSLSCQRCRSLVTPSAPRSQDRSWTSIVSIHDSYFLTTARKAFWLPFFLYEVRIRKSLVLHLSSILKISPSFNFGNTLMRNKWSRLLRLWMPHSFDGS